MAGGWRAVRLRHSERRLGVLRGRAFARLHEVLRRHRHCGRARRGMPYGMPLDVAASRRSAAASRLRARAGRMDVQRAGGRARRIPEAPRRAHRLGGRRFRVHARQVRDRPVAGYWNGAPVHEPWPHRQREGGHIRKPSARARGMVGVPELVRGDGEPAHGRAILLHHPAMREGRRAAARGARRSADSAGGAACSLR